MASRSMGRFNFYCLKLILFSRVGRVRDIYVGRLSASAYSGPFFNCKTFLFGCSPTNFPLDLQIAGV